MKIIVDAYGGDNAPLEILKGTADAVAEFGIEAVLCGDETELRELAEKSAISLAGCTFAHSTRGIPVEVEPTLILKDYADSSMAVGMNLLAAGEGDAIVTAGSTGAAVVGATMIVKRLRGVKRGALGTVIPSVNGCYMLLDVGANAECRPEMLRQFGVMGSVYMERIMGVEKPRVGLVNIGTEENKGLDLHIEAGRLLKESPIHFIGNVEARELPLGGCDVAVTDGFVGNVVLKLTEGMGKLISAELKKILLRNTATKIAAVALRGGVMDFRARMDYSEYGGAPILGISKPVIKAHGSSNAKAFKNAIRQAKNVVDSDVTGVIKSSLA
jgi:glycerol-3-phosphate acyltransferase PlsX